MRKSRKLSLVLIVFVIILILGLGYAYLTTTLSINGTTDIDANTWNVYFDNLQVIPGSVEAEPPIINSTNTSITFNNIHLSKPGDFYEVKVDVKNDGSIDAMVNEMNYTINGDTLLGASDYINLNITYSDGIPIERYQILKANSKEEVLFRLEYKEEIDALFLPSENKTLESSFETQYIQAEDAIPVRTLMYDNNEESFFLLENFNSQTAKSSYQELLSNNVFIRYTIHDGIIYKEDIGFIMNGDVYYLDGINARRKLIANYRFDNHIASNRELSQNPFGSENCTINGTDFTCRNSPYYVEILNNNSLLKLSLWGTTCIIDFSNYAALCAYSNV